MKTGCRTDSSDSGSDELTDVVFYSLLKKFINFLPVWLLLSQTDLILQPIEPDLCRIKKKKNVVVVTNNTELLSTDPKIIFRHTPTFSEWEKFTHLLPRLSQTDELSLLLQQFDEIYVAVVVESIDGQLEGGKTKNHTDDEEGYDVEE